MSTYGDKTEPGIISDIQSDFNVSTTGAAPSDLGIVGQAALSTTGSDGADPNTVYEVTRATQARTLFGSETESLLTQGIIDALREGAYPVYAAAPEEISVSDEDLSSLTSNEGTLAETPVTEDPSEITFTVNGTDLTTVKTYRDPSNETPGADEVYVNPVTGDFNIDSGITTGNTGDDVDYSYFDYPTAIDAMRSGEGGVVDFLVALNENQTVAAKVNATVGAMEDEHNFAIAIVGPGDTTIDPSSYQPSYDDSRTQVVFGTRFEDDTSILAAYAGKRAALGLERPPFKISLTTSKRIAGYQASDLRKVDRGQLIDANVVPLKDEVTGPLIIDDPTTVTDDNQDEGMMDYGYTRLLIDYVTTVTRENEKPFIGRLNNPSTRNTFRDLVSGELAALQRSGSVIEYNLNVEATDATTASLEMAVEVAKPLRFIRNEITVGEAV